MKVVWKVKKIVLNFFRIFSKNNHIIIRTFYALWYWNAINFDILKMVIFFNFDINYYIFRAFMNFINIHLFLTCCNYHRILYINLIILEGKDARALNYGEQHMHRLISYFHQDLNIFILFFINTSLLCYYYHVFIFWKLLLKL